MKKIIPILLSVAGMALVSPSAQAAETVYSFKGKIDELRVKVPKPEISYVLNRPDLTPKYEFELQESFLPRIEESVEAKPF